MNDQDNRFNLDENSLEIIDKYCELPEMEFTDINKAKEFVYWLNKNIKPKNILELLYREKINNETLSQKIEEYLKENKCDCCKVYNDSTFLVFEYEKDDYTTPKKVLKLFDLKYGEINYKSIFTTTNDCVKSRIYFLWNVLCKKWSD